MGKRNSSKAGYEFQSGGVVSLLEKLEDQFKEEPLFEGHGGHGYMRV